MAGAWDLFGGHVESGEAPEAALRRELHEELGIAPLVLRELGLLQSESGDWRLRVYAVTAWSGEPVNLQPAEHAELRWMSPAQTRECLSRAHADFADLIEAALAC